MSWQIPMIPMARYHLSTHEYGIEGLKPRCGKFRAIVTVLSPHHLHHLLFPLFLIDHSCISTRPPQKTDTKLIFASTSE